MDGKVGIIYINSKVSTSRFSEKFNESVNCIYDQLSDRMFNFNL